MATADYGVIGKFNGIGGAMKMAQEDALKAQLAQAQIATALNKSQYLDVRKLGEQSLYKAAMGLPLTPEETAAAKLADAKSGGVMFDPATGAITQKPTIAGKLGLNLGGMPAAQVAGMKVSEPSYDNVFGDYNAEEQVPTVDNEWDAEFQDQLQQAQGNPKLEQKIRSDFAKAKYSMNESQSKNATYADRLALAEPILTNPDKVKAYSSFGQKALDFVNPFGAQLNSSDYQSYKQAQLDAASARLRQESGAVIGESEYKYDKEQLYPQVGDSPEVIEQKRLNRETIKKGLARAAGPAYKLPVVAEASKTIRSIPTAAAQELLNDPSGAQEFDEIFGPGAAKMVLGQ